MTRAEELTLKLLEGTASEDELNELDWLTATNQEEANRYLTLMELEGALRSLRRQVDVTGPVMSAIEARVEKIKQERAAAAQPATEALAASGAGTSAEYSQRTANRVAGSRRRRRSRNKTAPLVMGAAVIVLFIAVVGIYVALMGRENTPIAPPTSAQIVNLQGSASYLRDGTRYTGKTGKWLVPGEALLVTPNSTAELFYTDETKITAQDDTVLKFVTDSQQAGAVPQLRHLALTGGKISVRTSANPALPMLIDTPHARVVPEGTRFEVLVNPTQTRVITQGGAVRVTSLATDETVQVAADHFAVVEAGLPLTVRRVGVVDRITEGLVAFYPIREAGGATLYDMSRHEQPMNLLIEDEGAVFWDQHSITLTNPTLITTEGPATKLIDAITQTNAVTVEMWIAPTSAAQTGPAEIVAIGESAESRNFAIGQGRAGPAEDEAPGEEPLDVFNIRMRTSVNNDPAGLPPVITEAGVVPSEASQVVVVRDPLGEVRVYVDAELVHQEKLGGSLDAVWATAMPLVVANGPEKNTPWLGQIYMLAFYNRALEPAEIEQNYNVGLTGQPVDPNAEPAPQPRRVTSWEDLGLQSGMGNERLANIVVEQDNWRLKVKATSTDDLQGDLLIRVRSAADRDIAVDVLDERPLQQPLNWDLFPVSLGAGEYIIEILADDNIDWQILPQVQVEKMVDPAAPDAQAAPDAPATPDETPTP